MSLSRASVAALAILAACSSGCSVLLDWSDYTGGLGDGGGDGGPGTDGSPGDATNDADANIEASDSAAADVVVPCGSGGSCAASAPSGWMGPVALYAGTAAAPACDASASSLFDGMGNLSAPAPTCSTCSCGTASASCAAPVVSIYEGASCSGNPTTTGTPSTSCTISAELLLALVSVSAPALTGSCAPGTSTPTTTPPSWGMVARACPLSGGTPGGCSTGATCEPPQPASTSVCVMQTGAATSCPSSYPSGPQIFYTGVMDGRGCAACTCSAPAGASCTIASPAVDTYTQPGCTTPDLMLSAPSSCTAVTEDIALELVASPMLSGTAACAVSGGGTPTGMALPTGATSFCCLP